MSEPPPNNWRRILAQAFADAEDHGLGTWGPSFQAHPGKEGQAADFIGVRCEFLFSKEVDHD